MATTTPPGGYASIPPPSSYPPYQPSTTAEFTSRASQIHQSFAATIRPWSEFFNLTALSIPVSFSEATFQIRNNLNAFRLNYTVISLLVLLFSLIYHPFSIIVFLITVAAWLVFYIYRDEPWTIFGITIDDRIALAVLSLFTILALIWASVWSNLIVSALISAVLVLFHAAIRVPVDVDDLESPYGSLLSAVDDPRGGYSQV